MEGICSHIQVPLEYGGGWAHLVRTKPRRPPLETVAFVSVERHAKAASVQVSSVPWPRLHGIERGLRKEVAAVDTAQQL